MRILTPVHSDWPVPFRRQPPDGALAEPKSFTLGRFWQCDASARGLPGVQAEARIELDRAPLGVARILASGALARRGSPQPSNAGAAVLVGARVDEPVARRRVEAERASVSRRASRPAAEIATELRGSSVNRMWKSRSGAAPPGPSRQPSANRKRSKSPGGFVDAGVDRVVSAWTRRARRSAYAPAALSARGYRKAPPGLLPVLPQISVTC